MLKQGCLILWLSLHWVSICLTNLAVMHKYCSEYPIARRIGLPQLTRISKTFLPKNAFFYHFQMMAGTDTGYGFFSPSVPYPFFVRFELRNAAGEKEIQLFPFKTGEGSRRMDTAIFGFKEEHQIDAVVARSWALRQFELNPDAIAIDLYFSYIQLPSLDSSDRRKYHIEDVTMYPFTLKPNH